jgi:spore maturation protein CgeB
LRKGVNQRTFDVPASGGFLLTDWKEALPELFEPEKEVVCYQSPGELKAMAAHYLRYPGHMDEIIRRARKRIWAEHTYLKRMQRLLNVIGLTKIGSTN